MEPAKILHEVHTSTMTKISRMRLRLVMATLGLCMFGHWVVLPIVQWCLRVPCIVASLPVGQGYRINIIAQPDPGFDTGPGLFYQLWKGQSLLIDRQYLGATFRPTENLRFEALILEEGNLIAICERSTPTHLVVMCDLASGEHWPLPRGRGETSFDSVNALRDRLLRRVQSSADGAHIESAREFQDGPN